MTTLAVELDAALASLPPNEARALETDVRNAIRRLKTNGDDHFDSPKENWDEVMALMRQHKPDLVESIGALAGVEFEAPPDAAPAPPKEW